jgi:hypothetical protein
MAKSSYAFNKLGFGLHLPNLPKADYLKLKGICQQTGMSMIQVILMGLRSLDYLPDGQWEKLSDAARRDV